MAILQICTYPDPVLLQPSKLVENIDEDLLDLIADMTETMQEAPGLGLAAAQVGSDKSLFIYQLPEDQGGDGELHVLINPKILVCEGKFLSENEGCLSLPGYRADVQRHDCIRMEAVDEKGRPVVIDAEGFLATVLQHEFDHTQGKVFIDRISRLKRDLYKRKVKKALRNQGG